MSRKHYRALAQALKESGASISVVRAIANTLKADNPRFDYRRFYEASGVGEVA